MRDILLQIWHELRELRKDMKALVRLLEARESTREPQEALTTKQMEHFANRSRVGLYDLPIRHSNGWWNLEDAINWVRGHILPPIKTETRGRKSKAA